MKRNPFTAIFQAQVVRELLREEKTIAQLASEHGIHPTQLNQWKSTALAGLASLFERKDSTAAIKAEYEQKLTEAYAEVGRLTTQITWLKKNLDLKWTRDERMTWLEREGSSMFLTTQAKLLGISRAS